MYLAVTDDHAGLKKAIAEVLPAANAATCTSYATHWTTCHARPQSHRAQELRWLYDRHDVNEARHDLTKWLERWSGQHRKLCDWVEANIEETFTFYRLPRTYKHLKSTNLLERLNQS